MSDINLRERDLRPDRSERYVLLTIALTVTVEICVLVWLLA